MLDLCCGQYLMKLLKQQLVMEGHGFESKRPRINNSSWSNTFSLRVCVQQTITLWVKNLSPLQLNPRPVCRPQCSWRCSYTNANQRMGRLSRPDILVQCHHRQGGEYGLSWQSAVWSSPSISWLLQSAAAPTAKHNKASSGISPLTLNVILSHDEPNDGAQGISLSE